AYPWADSRRSTSASLIRSARARWSWRAAAMAPRPISASNLPTKRRRPPKKSSRARARAPRPQRWGPTRAKFQKKNPPAGEEFAQQLAEHSSEGSARTMRGVQKRRPSLFDLVDRMKAITAPTLVMTGDEDWPCLEPALLMKRTIATAALVVMPNAGHTINLE